MTTQSLSSPTHHAAPAHQPAAALRATGVVVVLAVVIAIVAIAFALPAARSKPHDVPIGAAGPQAASGQVADMLEQNAPGAFEITYYPGEAALSGRDPQPRCVRRHLVRSRRPDPADRHRRQPDRRAAADSDRQRHRPARRRCAAGPRIIAPPTADGPTRRRACGVGAADHAGGPAARRSRWCSCFAREVWTRFAAAVVFAALAGATIAALLRFVLGSIDANFWGVAGGADSGRAGVPGCSMLGLGSLFGRDRAGRRRAAGTAAGQPAVGPDQCTRNAAKRLGALGQWLPQGATATLLRSTAFFGGAGATMRDRRAGLMGDRRSRAGRDRRDPPAARVGGCPADTYTRMAWDSTTVRHWRHCAPRSTLTAAVRPN